MAIAARLRDHLDREHIRYSVITHSKAYTAQEVAALAHVPGKELAKTIVVRQGDAFALVVLPAHHHVDVAELSREMGGDVRLATEAEFRGRFPECETGAMPPFGNLYGMGVWVARPLTRDDEIVFNAGTHTEAIRMKFADFSRLVVPRVGDFSRANA